LKVTIIIKSFCIRITAPFVFICLHGLYYILDDFIWNKITKYYLRQWSLANRKGHLCVETVALVKLKKDMVIFS